MMTFFRNICVVTLICNCLYIPFTIAANQTAIPLDRIVAIVDEEVILESELERELDTIKSGLSARMDLPPDDVLKEQVLERLLLQRLQLDEAERYGITVDDITLNENLKTIAANNGLDLKGLQQKILADGTDFSQYREQIRKELILHRLRQGLIGGRIKVSEAEIDEYLSSQEKGESSSEYLVSHIQLSTSDSSSHEDKQEIKKRIKALRDRLENGEDFARLAVTESDGRTALEGGNLGWHTLGELPKQFAVTLKRMVPGEISAPFQTDNGFHLLKLHETKGIKRTLVKQINARHILLTPDKLTTDEQVRTKLLDVRNQILNGASFAELAEELSADPGSAPRGGELGWSELNTYTPQFANVIKTLPVNKLSEPFRSPYGWHIVEVLGWREYDKTVELERSAAFQSIFARKAAVEEDLWLRQLRSSAFIEIRLN